MKRILTSCFGLGLIRLAPGTWGSLPTAIIFGLMNQFGAQKTAIAAVMIGLILFGSFVCVKFGPAVARMIGKKDPGQIVADELAGQAVTFLGLPFISMLTLTARQGWLIAAGGFILFRIFDITKPWPIRKIENLPGGWGILLDDIAAGIIAAAVLTICLFVIASWKLN